MKWLLASLLFVAITHTEGQELGPPGPPGPPGDPGSCDCGGLDVREIFLWRIRCTWNVLMEFEALVYTKLAWDARKESAKICHVLVTNANTNIYSFFQTYSFPRESLGYKENQEHQWAPTYADERKHITLMHLRTSSRKCTRNLGHCFNLFHCHSGCFWATRNIRTPWTSSMY